MPSTASCRLTTVTTVAATLFAAAAVVPSVASATVVTYEGPPDNEVLVLRAAPGEINRQGVQDGPIADSVSLYSSINTITQMPEQCADHRDYGSIDCHAPNGVRLELGDGDDRGSVSLGVTVPVAMLGGEGNDELAGNDRVNTFSGEAGNDILKGSGGDDALDGGEGNDELDGYAGADRLLGGGGDDLLYPDHYETPAADVVDGGGGVDRIESDWSTRATNDPEPAIELTLAGGADDGRPGEGDDIRNVERFTFSKAARFVGTDAAEYVKLHQVGDAGDLAGLGGDDELRGGDGADRIDGGAGADLLDGGYGDDVITGGPGRDRISADLASGDCGPLWCKFPSGNDVVQTRDGEADSITCGAGTDRVVADAVDTVAPDCETVERSAAGGSAGQGSGSGGSGGSGGTGSGSGTTAKLALPKGQKLGTALRKGLKVRVSGTPAGTRVKVRALSAGRIVASGAGRTATVTLRFTAKARRSLARKRSVRLTLATGSVRTAITVRR